MLRTWRQPIRWVQDRRGRRKPFPIGPGYLIDGRPVILTEPKRAAPKATRTASGSVAVPDARLTALSDMYSPEKTTPATVEFLDIAGLVRGAHSGEGLGNKFLSHVREVDAIIHVVRCFENDDVVHVEAPPESLPLAPLAGT